jgi:transcriptional regulator with XRE-family HTH domain
MKPTTVAQYITAQIEASGLTNSEIATALGYTPDRANMISMIRTGRSKLPINKVASMAKALHIDPAHLLRFVLREYSPDTLVALEEAIGTGLLTEGEQEVVSLLRREAGELPIHLADDQLVTIQQWARKAAQHAHVEQNRRFKEGAKHRHSEVALQH